LRGNTSAQADRTQNWKESSEHGTQQWRGRDQIAAQPIVVRLPTLRCMVPARRYLAVPYRAAVCVNQLQPTSS
jgi:hypothetical protein